MKFIFLGVVTPLDVVKVRMQSQPKPPPGRIPLIFHGDFFDNVEPCRASSCPRYMPKGSQPITGTFDGLRYIVANEGAHNLWRGLSPTLMMAVPATIVYFVGYEAIRNKLKVILPSAEVSAPLIAGASARVIAASMISPLELVRTNMQHLGPDGTVRTVLGQVMSACRAQGFSVLFKGLVPTLWRDVPFSALYWTSFERVRVELRPVLGRYLGPNSPSAEFLLSFMAGAVSGAIAAAATTPFDVAKTRTQIQLGQLAGKRPSMLSQLKAIWQSEGTAGLFSGLSPRIFKVAPACAIMIGSYEFCKAFFVQSKQPKS